MDPRSIALVKSVILATRMAEAEALTREALALESEIQVRELVARRLAEALPAELAARVTDDPLVTD
jgi:signal transduction protein with GAF and PtsI domain